MLSEKMLTKEKKSPLRKQRRSSRFLFTTLLMAMILTVFMSSCKEDDYMGEITGVCPLVTSTDPTNEAINVVSGKKITATFNENMDPSTINTTSFVVMQGLNPITGTVGLSAVQASVKKNIDPAKINTEPTLKQGSGSVSAAAAPANGKTTTFTFTPAAPLAPFTLYTATMKKGVRDPMNNALQEDHVWSFTTQPQVTASSSPAAGGTTFGAGLFDSETSITVKAVPEDGYTFINWTEDGTPVSTDAEYVFDLTGNRTLVANFAAAVGFTLNITAVNGSVAKNPNELTYSDGDNVILTATPSPGFEFTSWSGDATGTDNPLTVLMDGNKNITANFTALPGFTLNITAVNGSVAKNPNKLTYSNGDNVILTPTPNPGFEFTSWSGDATGTDNPLTVFMDGNKNITANFTALPGFALNITAVDGSVAKNPNKLTYSNGDNVILTPTPNPGFEFTSWSGDATGTDNPLTVLMDGNKNITANFTALSFALNITAVDGSVAKNPNELTYSYGDNVILTPTPNPGFEFTSWSGDATGTDNPLTVLMDGDKNITANFTALSFTLNVTAVNGTVAKNPNELTYSDGDNVILTATPDPGYEFTSWGGDAMGTDNPLTVLMDEDKNITANFTLKPPVGPGMVDLGKAGDFVILSKSGISTTGTTSITGNIGVSPIDQTALTGFSQIMDVTNTFSTSIYVVGKIYAADYTPPTPTYLTTAISDQETAFTTANGLTTNVIVDLGGGDISGMTLAPALYKWGTGLLITNAGVTLEGGPDDTWVFQISDDFTINNDAIITLAGGAQAKNIFWVTNTQALIGSNVQFKGNILAQTLISVNTGTEVKGRLLSQSAVTLNSSTVVEP